MALPELVRKSAEKIIARYCSDKRRADVRLGYYLRDDHITLYEETAPPHEPRRQTVSPLAQVRYNHDLNQWTLHYPDRHKNWHFYLNVGPALDLSKLLRHFDEDPLGIFWDR